MIDIHWDGKIAYCLTGNQWANEPEKLLDRTAYEAFKAELKLLAAKVKAGTMKKEDFDERAGEHKKQIIRYTSLDYVDWEREHCFKISDDVQESYRRDRNRKGVNLFDEKKEYFLPRKVMEDLLNRALPKDIATLTPCHYILDNEQVTAFGHGQCFRIPYEKTIGEAVNISDNDKLDFADLVFGTQDLASRVYFEDATPLPEKFFEAETAKAHPLMQPNPTSYQLYLVQKDGGKLNHWDTVGAQIRGYKFYWHKPATDWHATEDELKLDRDKSDDKRLIKDMTPLRKGSVFKSKIRFKNLSAVELGALLMIFDLDGLKTAAYKIGQVKPFGFGSVKISPKLFVEDETAYSELFDGDAWKNPCREENPDTYLAHFKKYLDERGMKNIWRKVLGELKMILDWSNTEQKNWSTRVKSMSGDVSQRDGVDKLFKERVPLPSLFEVVK